MKNMKKIYNYVIENILMKKMNYKKIILMKKKVLNILIQQNFVQLIFHQLFKKLQKNKKINKMFFNNLLINMKNKIKNKLIFKICQNNKKMNI